MLKLIGVATTTQVHPESAESKIEWLKCLSDGGSFVSVKLGGAKKKPSRFGDQRRSGGQDHGHRDDQQVGEQVGE